jgi:arylsulfatase A-like enzyme/predicted negative regulator of RcsB-dependent stress response
MDRLASEGARFETAHAHNVVTLPSHASILSGRLPQHHGVRDNSGFRFPEEVPTLASVLAAHGYRTGAFVSAFPLDSRFGLARGFEVYEDAFVDAGIRPAFIEQERRAADTVSLARAWIESGDGRPTFTWVHLYEPHYPYQPPEPLAARFAGDLYQGEVAAVDAALGLLLEPLLDASSSESPLIVVTSDHGESLGEHGEATHGIFTYEGPLRVPLVLHQPHLVEPQVVAQEVRLIDLLPTVLDLLDLQAPNGVDGQSLRPVLQNASGQHEPRETYFEALSGQLNRGWAPLYGVIRDGWKYIDLPIPELYDLRSDPGEAMNRASSERRRVGEMRDALAALRTADMGAVPRPESTETRRRLRALGYLGGGDATERKSWSEADDPKRLIALDEALRDVAALYDQGDLTTASARSRELVRRRPGMRIAIMQWAQIEHDLGNLDVAIDAMRRAFDLQPADTVALAALASYLIQAGRAAEAVELTEAFTVSAAPEVDLLLTHSLGLARLERVEDGLKTLARAAEIEPGNPLVAVYRGTLHLMGGRRREAMAAFEHALTLNPDTVRALTALAVMATEEGRTDEALALWRRAAELDPREFEKLAAVGGRLWSAGRQAQARPLLELFVGGAPRDRYGEQIERVQAMLGS